MDIERMTDEQISEYIKLRQQENPSDYSYQQKGPSRPGVMGTALVELDKDGNPRKSKQYLDSIAPKLGKLSGTTEIDAEIKRLTALKEQNNQAQAQTTESNKPADGIYNPADYISKITSKMNEAGYTDEQGNKKSYGRGDKFSNNLDVTKNAGRRTGFEQDKDGTPLPETAYEWITQQLNEARASGPINKYTLRAIENGAKVRYNVPSNFDISGKGWIGNTDAAMARAMNSMSYNGKTQPAQTPQPAQARDTKTEDKPKGKQVANSNKGVAGASVGDFIVRSDGSTHVITQADIDWAKKKTARQTQQVDSNTVRGTKDQMKADIANGNVKPTYNENSIIGATQEELDAMKAQGLSDDLYNKGIQAIKNGNGLNDDMQFMQKYSKAAGSRKPEDRAFLTSENAKRYNDIVHKQNETKKASKNAKKIEKLRQELETHKKIMAENPDRPDIQKAQQTWVDDITKDIQKLGGSVE